MNVVYFIQRQDGAIKIGTTNNVRRRIDQIQLDCGKVKVLGVVPGSRKEEKALHVQFAHCNIRSNESTEREWFSPNADLLDYIKQHGQEPKYETYRIDLFMNERDKRNLNMLLARIESEGVVEVKDNRGKPSVSALVRYLIHKELERGS